MTEAGVLLFIKCVLAILVVYWISIAVTMIYRKNRMKALDRIEYTFADIVSRYLYNDSSNPLLISEINDRLRVVGIRKGNKNNVQYLIRLMIRTQRTILGENYFKLKKLYGQIKNHEVDVISKNGELRTWLISGTPNLNMKGEITGSIFIHLDITDRKDLENKQVELLKDLEVQNQELNDYAHIVSHDLKSPLRNISALLSWTREDFKNQLGDDSLINIDLMQDKVEKMDHLIENILKYSSIDRSSASVEKVDVQALVEDIIAMIYIPDHIEVTIKNKLPVINADTTRIQQLFQNIISNAVNYIDKEKGIVEVDVEENPQEYIFSVKDNGVGIPADQHDRIFQIFNTASDHKKSTGIGLSIVRKIIDLYHGRVWLESTPQVGTTFNFSIKKNL